MENPLDLPTPPPLEPAVSAPLTGDISGRTLGDFQLIRRIGQGGMGQVYLARQLSLKRQVAIKILRTDLASNTTNLQRFKREAEAVACFTHANIVQVYWIGEADGLHYMALEYVEGRNLRDYINRKGPPDLPIALNIMRQVAAALQRAGELGFVHRDIKPENILLTRKGEVKVADFGLSRCFSEDQPMNITQSGVTMGTPLYMSPEQVQGHTVDPRSDIYSFGVTCFHMLTGEPPFKGQTPFEVALQHVQNEPPSLLEIRPDLPAELATLINRMMAKRPDDRYQNAREVLRDLARLKDRLPPSATPAAISQSGSGITATTRQIVAANAASASDLPVVAHSRWRRGLIVVMSLLLAGAAGAFVHWKKSARAETKQADPKLATIDVFPNPAEALEKELQKRLHDANIKSDRDVLNALLELTMLELHEKRANEPLSRFDTASLKKLPAVAEAQKSSRLSAAGQFYYILSSLGKGIVLAHQDLPAESNAEFRKVLGQAPLPSGKGVVQVEAFLWRYDQWKRLVADSLERNAKNLGPGAMDETLNRFRSYSFKGP